MLKSSGIVCEEYIWEPLYQQRIVAYPWEMELIKSPEVRRLKHLYHFGTAALASPVVHSRYEHTLGVWALTSLFLPNDLELRVAAILHDIGHLPFSHTTEKSLNLDHHVITKEFILEGNIANILNKHGFDPLMIIKMLDSDTALTNTSDLLALDHLDSFLRDTYHSGLYKRLPSKVVSELEIFKNCINAEYDQAMYLLDVIKANNRMMLSPKFIAMDELLSIAILHFCDENEVEPRTMQSWVDFEVLSALQNSKSQLIKKILHYLLWCPDEIKISELEEEGTIKASPRKCYIKQPLIDGIPLFEVSKDTENTCDEIENELMKTYYITL